jgi:hypothetical protein
MSNAYKIITPVTTEPISLSDAKAYLRVDFSDEDTVISNIISRARAYAEDITHRALATQSIQAVYTIDRPLGGELSGPLNQGPNWYQYQEQLGANPFGAAQFYFDCPAPPIQANQTITIETRTTVFDTWQTFTGIYTVDDVVEPARIYIMDPITANQWRFTFTTGYNPSYPCPPDIIQCLYELIAFWYENREAVEAPQPVVNKLLSRRVDWI